MDHFNANYPDDPPDLQKAMKALQARIGRLNTHPRFLNGQELVDELKVELGPFADGPQENPGPIYLYLKCRIFRGHGGRLVPGGKQGLSAESFARALYDEAIREHAIIWDAVLHGIQMETIPDQTGAEAVKRYKIQSVDIDSGGTTGHTGQPLVQRTQGRKAKGSGTEKEIDGQIGVGPGPIPAIEDETEVGGPRYGK